MLHKGLRCFTIREEDVKEEMAERQRAKSPKWSKRLPADTEVATPHPVRPSFRHTLLCPATLHCLCVAGDAPRFAHLVCPSTLVQRPSSGKTTVDRMIRRIGKTDSSYEAIKAVNSTQGERTRSILLAAPSVRPPYSPSVHQCSCAGGVRRALPTGFVRTRQTNAIYERCP